MFNKSLKTGLLTATFALGLSAQAQTTLASWTFEQGYTASAIDDKNKLYSPTGVAATDDITEWFTGTTPHILPETCVGEVSAFDMSGYSEGRYYSLCNGWENRVFRIENTVANEISNYSDASQHKCYYQVSFPTKGYKDIAISYAIAPGNNTETPIEMVVSTDGGTTWVDAGAKNSSGVWFQYVTQTVEISANNKDKVIVRLLPTAGTTNWNLSEFSISGNAVEALPSVDNAEINFSWPLGSVTPELAATPSIKGLFSVCDLAIGTGLTISKTGSPAGGSVQTLFKPSNSNSSDFTEEDALIMTVAPKAGISFKPTHFSFEASKHGTGGGNIGLEVRRGDKTVMVNSALSPARNNNGDGVNFTKFDEKIEGFDASSEAVTIVLYINKLASNKEYGFANLMLYGVANGQVEAVPVYTFKLISAIEGAGTLSCAPAGTEFDSGTTLKVSTDENFGYHFKSWNDENGKVISTENPYSFEIKENTVLVANYDKTDVYALNLAIEGGANVNQILYTPEGHVVDGIHYYEAGTDVQLTTVNNRILTFTNWEDNTTAPERVINMDSEKNITATFSAMDYIVGWDFYFDTPNSERAADFKAESDNAGLLSLRNASGQTSTWLTRGVGNGAENGKWGARIWRNRADGYYFEASFSTLGYSNVIVAASLGVSYNSRSVNNMQYSIDGENFTTVGTYNLAPGWVSNEFALPKDADNQKRVWVRFMPDNGSDLVGNETDYDGLCISDLYVLADKDSANDNVAPVLVSTIPADKSNGVSATGSIILTFDEKIKIGSGNATLNGEVLTPTVSGKSMVYKYSSLEYNTDYTFVVPAGAIVDRSGNTFAGVNLSFTTLERQQPEARLFDVIVASDGSGDFTSLQSAIDAAPENRIKPWLIFVKNGNYNEHIDIPANKPMLHIIGQDRDKTVVLDNRLCGGENAYHVSKGATVVINSNDCLFENITLENSYGHELQAGPQALALNTSGDRTIFNNVAMLSYQDTWITPSTSNYRAYVRNSFIEGAVDFIYNSGNIYIDNTTLYINRQNGGFIVAPSHAADVEWGYVFNNCTITAPGVPSETSVWLGRPWHNSPKTVFLNTRAEVTIPATGWYETMGGLPVLWADWNTTDADGNLLDLSQRRDTYYKTDADGNKVYGKAKNYLTDEEAAQYTVRNVLSGSDNWEPVIKTEACATPSVKFTEGTLSWNAVPYAICYLITKGDEFIGFTTECSYLIGGNDSEGYTIQAINEYGGLSAKGKVDASSAIDSIVVESDGKITEIYDLNGRRLASPVKGINIVKIISADGSVSVKKIAVR